MSAAVLQAEQISFCRNGRKILDGVDLEIAQSEIVTLVGPNGAGKTTLIRILLGLLQADGGKVNRSDSLVIGYMPQKLKLTAHLPLSVSRFLRLTPAVSQVDCERLAERLGITHLLSQPLHTLSGGETQRALLARALLRKPTLLVLDEPVQGVDVTGQAELYGLISSLRDETGCAVLMVSHDLHLVMATTDKVLCLNQHICCAGHPESVTRHPAYLELFGQQVGNELAVYTHHHDHAHDIHGNVVCDDGEQHG